MTETRAKQFPPPVRVKLEEKIEVNGVLMTYPEWKQYIDYCPHDSWSYPGVELMDGSPMAICNRCKFIQHETIAKIIEGQEEF